VEGETGEVVWETPLSQPSARCRLYIAGDTFDVEL
jgi:hypothetical protein